MGYNQGEEHEFRCHPIQMIVYEQTVVGSVGATLEDLKEAVQYVGEGKIRTVVDSVISLNKFQDGLDKIKSCDCVGKIVCLPCRSFYEVVEWTRIMTVDVARRLWSGLRSSGLRST